MPEYGGGTSSDAVVVGGRVAGALAAAHLAAAGLDVVVLESAAITSGTISTHFFRGDGLVAALAEVGALDEVLETGPPRLTCDYWYPDAGEQPEVDPPQEPGAIGYCLSVRRETLDPLLAAHVARQRGVRWLDHRRVVGLVEAPDGLGGVVDANGDRHLAALVVGADGRRSTVARLVGAPAARDHPAARVLIYRYPHGVIAAPIAPRGPSSRCAATRWPTRFRVDLGTTCLAVTVPIDHEPAVRADTEGFFDARLAGHRGIWSRYLAADRLGRVVAGRPTPDYVAPARGARVGPRRRRRDPPGPVERAGHGHRGRQARALADAVAGGGDWQAAYAVVRDAVTLERYDGDDRGSRRPEHAACPRRRTLVDHLRRQVRGPRAGVVGAVGARAPAGASSSAAAPPAPSGGR